MTDDLFVYGSLRTGAGTRMEAELVRGARAAGRGWLPGRLYDLGAYPGYVPGAEDDGRVLGEVWTLTAPETLLPLLDRYEGCTEDDPEPHEYRRVVQTVQMADGSTREAWVYVYNRPPAGLRPIPGGDYLRR